MPPPFIQPPGMAPHASSTPGHTKPFADSSDRAPFVNQLSEVAPVNAEHIGNEGYTTASQVEVHTRRDATSIRDIQLQC